MLSVSVLIHEEFHLVSHKHTPVPLSLSHNYGYLVQYPVSSVNINIQQRRSGAREREMANVSIITISHYCHKSEDYKKIINKRELIHQQFLFCLQTPRDNPVSVGAIK